MASLFNAKYFNQEVVIESVGNLRDATKLELVALAKRTVDNELSKRMPDQKGGNIATIIIHGNLSGTSDNYDGSTNINVSSLTNYAQTVVAIGRAHAWGEEDFQTSIAGYSELDAQIYQLAIYQDKQVKNAVISTLKGIFATALAAKVATATAVSKDDMIDLLVASAGDMADEFDTVVMDSYVAGELAKLSLLSYGTYQIDGVQYQDQKVGYWAGRKVIIDDAVGTNSNASGSVHKVYAFAPYSFRYTELPVKVPFELTRDALTDGGKDIVVERQRFVLAPEGVSFDSTGMASLSPTNTELETGSHWAKVVDGNNVAIDDKLIPFACLEITLP